MKQLRIALMVLCTCIVGLMVQQYFFCPRYQFNTATPFQGTIIRNPYELMNSKNWIKCNFHAHSKSWGGITNGHGTARDVHQAYEKLHYGMHCVSNYHDIDSSNIDSVNYLSAYEHGYNIQKTHQLVLGSRHVVWLDYIFPQTTHNKQHLIQRLREANTVTILNHPALRKGYTPEDLTLLTGYDCMEVLNPSATSTAEWDAALSAGRTAFIAGDDDIHDVIAKKRLGTRCTFVNVTANSGDAVMQALKTGNSYGVIISETQHYDSIPQLRSLTVNHDSIQIEMSAPAQCASLTGQNGNVLHTIENTNRISYRIKPQDHYARATFKYSNGTTIFLNPVYYSSPIGAMIPPFHRKVNETTFFRILGVCAMVLWIILCKWWLSPKPPRHKGWVKHTMMITF
ncbi:hypothetical protein [Dyadobacter sediminis]|uniref:Uncharacterized protein n=1 Tax=Dyadobacter sediminis TaxID=1493691 RepID=A0A5R9K6P1_9BACT|nr:hypothetical protein [Dyadobacter sediminis]TLU89447.1 hypothetical protein FEM55_22160 [Dyadobacter sediminis]GGC05342.1 hypothetical protein GCM10011325_35280 [Dyadobacter sediminis]